MQPPVSCPVFRRPVRPAGFSLVEVVMALGIMSFALMGIVGLLPAGLSQFRQAVDVTMKAQISQELTSSVQRTDFADLNEFGSAGSPKISYYDAEGAELAEANKENFAYMAKTYVADLSQLLAPTWAASAGGPPLNNVSAVKIEITSRTAPDRPHTSVSYVANTGS
jgi:uncharacterized protein (TIGR02598 family)